MENLHYLALLHKVGLSQKKLHYIFQGSDNYKDIYCGLSADFLSSYTCTEKQILFILDAVSKINTQYIEDTVESMNVTIIDYHSEKFPEMLKNISNPPFVLYVQGRLDNSPKFSVVGSRNITTYGKKCIDYLIPGVGKYFSIVSGGALGCDSEAHMVALKNNIKTIAVVGTGIDECYPSGNRKIYDAIIEKGGAIVSIFPFGEPANRYNFPVRNEIVAGLSIGTLVVEAKGKSGSLITAKLCLDLGRDLFACPGEIFKSNSDGCNALILGGMAKIVTHFTDILSEYNVAVGESKENKKKQTISFQDPGEQKLYELLLLESMTIDELIEKTGFDIKMISLKLSLLEIGGFINTSIGGKYELK